MHLMVHGRERTSFEDVSDANWLRVDISVRAAGCSAEIASAMTSSEFSALARDLLSIVPEKENGASLRTMEEWLELDISVGKSGTVLVSGKVQTFGTPGASLLFRFESDLSALKEFTQDAIRCARAYPVIQR